MNLYLDTTEEFSSSCCALLKAVDQRGLLCTDFLEVAKGKQDFDQRTSTWLYALSAWRDSADVRAVISGESAAIRDTGRAYFGLLADVAQAMAEGLVGADLLARIQPHFPGIDLETLLIKVRADEAAHRKASDRRFERMVASLSSNADDGAEEPEPPALLKLINPEDSPEMRAAALIWQLLGALGKTPPQSVRLMDWNVDKQPGPITRFIEEYCIFDTPQDLPQLIARQYEAAERGLELKLALLQETLAGIVSLRLQDTLAHMSSFFDGDLPGLKLARWMHDDRPTDPANILRLDGMEESGCWRISCKKTSAVITDADAGALLATLEQLLHQLPSQYPSLSSAFEKSIAALVELDDRDFQAYIRENQSSTFCLMLSGLPEHRPVPPDFDEVHPFYRKVGRNMSLRAWEILEDDVANLGNTPLDAFELAQVLDEIRITQPNIFPPQKSPKRWLRIVGNAGESEPPTLELPDCRVSQSIALVERFPRQITLVVGEGEAACHWKVNIDEMQLFACQLRHRAALHSGEAEFVRAWLGEWLADMAKKPVVRRQRFLRTLSVSDAALLFSITPSENQSDWLATCSSAALYRLRLRMDGMLTDEQCAEAARIIFAHEMFSYQAVY